MEWLRIFGARLRGLFRKRQLDGDLDAELRAHLEMLTEEKHSPRHESRGSAPCRAARVRRPRAN